MKKTKHKKRGRKPLKVIDSSEVIGKCYICKGSITKAMVNSGTGLSIGKGTYRCRSKKCEKKVINAFLKNLKTRKT
ncbi:hypothetical protein LCGC14_1027280, partial [marine sediment metagenome]